MATAVDGQWISSGNTCIGQRVHFKILKIDGRSRKFLGTLALVFKSARFELACLVKMIQILQYWDDSVDAWYRDGSRVALSACGTVFTYWRRAHALSGGRPCNGVGQERVHQLTQYVISEYRQKITALVNFRNRFAEQPFVCRAVVNDHLIQVRQYS